MKILIVDDEKEMVELLKERAVAKDHAVHAAYDGKQALRLIKSNNYDLIFLDHDMPEMTGVELVKYLKRNNIPSRTAMITGYTELEEFFAKSIGIDEFLAKPVKMKHVDDIIDKYTKLIS